MRGDQLSRQWRVIRAIEGSPNGLTVAEIAKREETGIRSIYRDLEALQSAGFPLYTERVDKANRCAFIDIFKLKIQSLSKFNQSTWLLFKFFQLFRKYPNLSCHFPVTELKKPIKLFSGVSYTKPLVRRSSVLSW